MLSSLTVAFFAATWGPLAWVVTSEIYPTTTRGVSIFGALARQGVS